MPRPKDITHRQTIFLRAFRTNPAGPPPDAWPSPAILRKWLRRPTFKQALDSVLESLRFQADFQLALTATHAARYLGAKAELSTLDFQRLLRLGHLRQRFNQEAPDTKSSDQNDNPDDQHNHDPYECMKQIPPEDRLTREEFHDVAWHQNYGLPLKEWPDFPPPTPQDTFYYQLIMNPSALLYYLDQYGKHTGDHRHSPIVTANRLLVPTQRPGDSPLPRFPQPADAPQPSAIQTTDNPPASQNLHH